ncbi:hypothetical protein OX284_011535 [Flavobacterium sp. SUN046]|uniref:hypothetical protein n=1 Tax=Flavobacterium sp. SUN046 TaxID=3002440 RepID=UPI002DBE84AB|nr:hypothetical protein [Flavobacterium sp. SUN046]MEC4050064.1 hypothetical protein [Flavobacterium sp. SUN046]
MVTAFVTIQVENFLAWKKLFSENEDLRKGLNIKIIDVYLLVSDVEIVTIIAEVESKEQFDYYYFNDPTIKNILNNYCYKVKPIVEYYNKID